MNEITKYIKKMLKDVGDMLDTMSMVKNPKAVSALKASISGLLIAAGGLYAGTQIHQAVNPVPETKDPGVIFEDLEEPDRIPSNEPSQSVEQKVEEKKPSEPSQSAEQKAVEEKPSKAWTKQEIYEHYKPGLSVGDDCSEKNKCSDKKREFKIYLSNKLVRSTGKLKCQNSRCGEVILTNKGIIIYNVEQKVEEEKPSEPSQSAEQKVEEEKPSEPSQSAEQKVEEEKPSEPSQSAEQKVEEKKPSEPSQIKVWDSQKIYEHYKPGESVGDSCKVELAENEKYGRYCKNNFKWRVISTRCLKSQTQTCSKRKRKNLVNNPNNVTLSESFSLRCNTYGKCKEGLLSWGGQGGEIVRERYLAKLLGKEPHPNYPSYESDKPNPKYGVGASCSFYKSCSRWARIVRNPLYDSSKKEPLDPYKIYGLTCDIPYNYEFKCEEVRSRLIRTELVSAEKNIYLKRILDYGTVCVPGYCFDGVIKKQEKVFKKKPSTSSGQR